MTENVMVTGIWKILRPDVRQYKQQSIEIEFNQRISVSIPAEYIVSTDDQGAIINPAGMKYIQEQFEKLYGDAVETDGWGPETREERLANMDNDPNWGFDHDPATKDRKGDPDWANEPASDDWGPDPSTLAVLEVEDAKLAEEEEDWGGDLFTNSMGNTPDTDTWNESEEDWK